MANKFTVGMRNLVEVLNQMWDAFAAGPYNAVPLTGGRMSGTLFLGTGISASFLTAPPATSNAAAGATSEPFRLGVTQTPTNWPGCWSFLTSQGNGSARKEGYRLEIKAYDTDSAQFTPTLFAVQGDGTARVGTDFTAPGVIYAGVENTEQQGVVKMRVANSGYFAVCSSAYGNSSATALNLAANTVTNRSLNVPGTVNANGADYAEYMAKSANCGTVAPGQIIGIAADGHLTDEWGLAISFAVKSTNPCMVGGDTWAANLGARPQTPVAPTVPVRQDGDTDAQWAKAQGAYREVQEEFEAALSAVLVEQQEFDEALETARQTVDRIAFAGQVPVNLQGATPGQYIVPVQDGDAIAGLAVDEADITLRQYMRSIGRVIAIEDDGRARIIVKVA
jgi:hypothetical protein